MTYFEAYIELSKVYYDYTELYFKAIDDNHTNVVEADKMRAKARENRDTLDRIMADNRVDVNSQIPTKHLPPFEV